MSSRRRLNSSEVFALVAENLYRPDPAMLHAVRCIDADDEADSRLAPISYPGGDMGILGLVYASGQAYGFEIDHSRAYDLLLEISGGIENFSYCEASKDERIDSYLPFASDVAFDDDIQTLIAQQYQQVRDHSRSVCRSVQDDHHLRQSAILTVKGPYAVAPTAQLTDENGRLYPVIVYTMQKTYLSAHVRLIADRLLSDEIVTLYPGCDQDYLYEVLAEMSDTCFYSSLQAEFKQIPIFSVEINDDASFTVTEV